MWVGGWGPAGVDVASHPGEIWSGPGHSDSISHSRGVVIASSILIAEIEGLKGKDGLKRKDPWRSKQAKTACLLVSLPCQVLCPVPYMSACVSNQFLQEPFFANSAVHNKITFAFIGIEANWPILGEKLTKTFINWLLWLMQNFRTLMMTLHCLRNYQPQDDGPRPHS